jgi:hypothetical protein
VTKIKAPGEDDNPTLPIVHFSGTSRSMHESWDPNTNSTLRGSQLALHIPSISLSSSKVNVLLQQVLSDSPEKVKLDGPQYLSSTGTLVFSYIDTMKTLNKLLNRCTLVNIVGRAKEFKSAAFVPLEASWATGLTSRSPS